MPGATCSTHSNGTTTTSRKSFPAGCKTETASCLECRPASIRNRNLQGYVSCTTSFGSEQQHMQVERNDWLKVAKGILSLGFWRGKLTTHPSYSWYLQRARGAVHSALAASEGSQVVLVGHSAGGWLARAFAGPLLLPLFFTSEREGTGDIPKVQSCIAHKTSTLT